MIATSEQCIFGIIVTILIVIGSLANLTALWVFYHERSLRNNIASAFLINLIIIDISICLFVMPLTLAAVIVPTLEISDVTTKISSFIATSLELVSMLALGIISLDRLAAVMKPLCYRARMTVRMAVQMNVYIWLQALIFSLVPIHTSWYIFNRNYMACTFIPESSSTGFYVYMGTLIICNFVFSLLVILSAYFYIFRVARSHRKRISNVILPISVFNLANNKQQHWSNNFRRREIRTASKILFVIGAFMICHVPYATLRMLELSDYEKYKDLPATLRIMFKIASFSKSTIDPFIYCLLQKRFRKAFLKSLLRIQSNKTEHASLSRCSYRKTNGVSILSENNHGKVLQKTHVNQNGHLMPLPGTTNPKDTVLQNTQSYAVETVKQPRDANINNNGITIVEEMVSPSYKTS